MRAPYVDCRTDTTTRHDGLSERVRREAVGAVHACRRDLSHRKEPGDRRAAIEIGANAATRVVRSGRDRNRLSRRIDASRATDRDGRWELRFKTT